MEPKVFWGDNVARGVWQSWLAMNHAALILTCLSADRWVTGALCN